MSSSSASFYSLFASALVPRPRGLVWSGALLLAAIPLSRAQTQSAWTGAAGDGRWAAPGNWTAGVPEGETAAADFTQLDLTANVVIDAEAVTVNRLVFGDTTPGGGNWYLGDALLSYTFTLAGASPTVTVGDLGANLVSFSAGNGPLHLAAPAGFIKDGPGRLDLAGNNTLAGRIVVRAGTLGGGNAATLNGAETVELAGGNLAFGSGTVSFNPALELSASGTLGLGNNSKTLAGPIRGVAGTVLTITQSGGASSTTSLSGSVAEFFGELVLINRYYRLETSYATTNAAAGANAIWTVNTGTTGAAAGDGALFYRNGTNATVTIDLGALQGAGVLRGGGAAGTGTIIYRVGALGRDTVFSGLLRDGALDATAFTKAGLTKIGSGTLTLSGANAYTGATLVSAGTLAVNGDQSAATGALTVSPGATLRGSGILGGAATIQGIIAPGSPDTPGTLTIKADLNLAASTVTILRINATTHDTLSLVNPDASGAITRAFAPGGVLRLIVAADAPLGAHPVLNIGANITRATDFAAVETVLPDGTITLAPAAGVWSGTGGARSYAFDPAAGSFTIAAAASLTALQTWRDTHFGTVAAESDAADAADPDHDGIPNLIEYATGGDPRAADVSPLALGRDPAGHLTLTFPSTPDATVRYVVQASDDLVVWNPVFTATGDTLGSSPTTVTDPEPLAGHSRRFLRLVVELVP